MDKYAVRLANNDLTDIVLTQPLDQATQKCADRLMDLSGMEFTSRYNLLMLNSIAQDGAFNVRGISAKFYKGMITPSKDGLFVF